MVSTPDSDDVAILGGGPAGLMAAEVLSRAGCAVTVYDRMPSLGRKFLLAGRGGLNLTHGEDRDAFLGRYGTAAPRLAPALDAFTPGALAAWCESLGVPAFVGSSGRVFPSSFKASPVLRAWLRRLEAQGVRFEARHTWVGWSAAGRPLLRRADGSTIELEPRATLLALGGASWPKLGADGSWVPALRDAGVEVADLQAANSGIALDWSPVLRARFAGAPLKRIAVTFKETRVLGEAIVTAHGLEGGALYALSSRMRAALAETGACRIDLDLRPDLSLARLVYRLERPRGKQSLTNFLRKATGLSPVAIGLLREGPGGATLPSAPEALAARIKALPLAVRSVNGLERAISSSGGIALAALDENYMLTARPGVFAAGEMLDWEAPTGGYLLQGCFSTGHAAAQGMLRWLGRPVPDAGTAPQWALPDTVTRPDAGHGADVDPSDAIT